MQLSDKPLISSAAIERRLGELTRQISDDFAGSDLVVVVVLKGAMVVSADLVRGLGVPVTLEFLRARSYQGTSSSGDVEVVQMPDTPLTDKQVLIVEDIIDTGHTATAVMKRLAQQEPARIAICALLDKPSRRKTPLSPDYVGFTVDDHFVVGYGLDYREQYRHLPDIWTLSE